jgi:integrase
MSVMLRTQRNGALRPFWYGEYKEAGRRKVINLGVKWNGTPPASGSLLEPGDKSFETSREKAEATLERFRDEAARKGNAAHLVERLIEAKTGRRMEHVRLDNLADHWLASPKGRRVSNQHAAEVKACIMRFCAFMGTRNSNAAFVYEVTQSDAVAYIEALRTRLTPRTTRKHAGFLQAAFKQSLPEGARNPFEGLASREPNGDQTMHRVPFTAAELQAILATADNDEMMRDLITAAACTGMRRGDVCRLRWTAVDMTGDMLNVKTSKTGAGVEIPIFDPLRLVLKSRNDNGSEFVFPEAAAMIEANPTGLTYRFKRIIALALGLAEATETETKKETVDGAEIEAEGVAAIEANTPDGPRRTRILEAFKRYCAGQTYRQIEKESGIPRGVVSVDLRAVEDWVGKCFVRSQRGPDMRRVAARVTRVERDHGMLAASVRDWHALRATWVTLALSAGVPMELVRRVTGHATVEVVLKHYFRPDREQFRAALTGALPEVLTGKAEIGKAESRNGDGGKRQEVSGKGGDLVALAGKVAAGTATKAETARFKKLAAGVSG